MKIITKLNDNNKKLIDDNHFMSLALEEATLALKAGEFPVGCVIASENELLVTGSRTGTAGKHPNEIDHAEITALKRLSVLKKPFDPKALTLYCTLEPCLMCFGAILLSNIGRLVYAYEDVMGGATGCDLSLLTPLYQKNTISIMPDLLRKKSLMLFKTYFSNPAINYWQDSLLARYTLEQKI